jgi:hypothetical protein
MKTHRVWFEIVVYGTAIACALALLIAMLGAAAGAQSEAASQASSQTTAERAFDGMVTCSRCGARHSAKLGKAADVCVRVCVHDGGKFALVDAETTFILDGDLNAIKKFAGQRAHVTGTLSGNTIKIASITAES